MVEIYKFWEIRRKANGNGVHSLKPMMHIGLREWSEWTPLKAVRKVKRRGGLKELRDQGNSCAGSAWLDHAQQVSMSPAYL